MPFTPTLGPCSPNSNAVPVPATLRNRRVLVIDDNISIHEDVRKILCPPLNAAADSLAELEAELLGKAGSKSAPQTIRFEVDSAHQGREGLALVERAIAEGRPYAMAFVDVRMPPGWDGIETTVALWKIQPDLQIVICTAYSDYSWEEMLEKLGSTDRLVILRKPFDTIEVLQLANSLTEKWTLVQETRRHAAELEERVRARTKDLETANGALQAEISRRVAIEADLVRAKDAAESADRAKSAFLANMSHEIRTPMNGVIGMANLLLSTQLDQQQHDFVHTLSECCDSLLTIINDILDFSKIEAGRLELETIDFDLPEALQLALDLQVEAAAKKHLELVLEIDPTLPSVVRSDPVRLRQVLLNLIGNAVKFTERGEVVVRVKPEPAATDRVGLRFEIADTGVGIAPDVQSGLFQPFVQADSSTTRRYGGTGLGLAISKRLVELMGGQIGVNSTPGRGSTFWFTVQLQPAEDSGNITFLPVPVDGQPVLVVDDSAANRELLRSLLGQWGANVTAMGDAVAAYAELQRAAKNGTRFALVVIDQDMPGTGGFDLAAQIRDNAALRHPALVLLASRRDWPSQEKLSAHGIDACEAKPIHANKLRATVARVLTHVRPQTWESNDSAAPFSGLPPILVAEDNPVNQKVITLLLRNLGYGCVVVANGREAVEALRRETYPLVLMDEHMPEMDGLAATQLIRREAAAGLLRVAADVPIIATTANAMPGTRERCIEAGMDDYLTKPIRIEALRTALARHLANETETLERRAAGT